MIGPDRNHDYKPIGDCLAEMLPTPFLEFRGGVLHQWFEASAYNSIYGGVSTIGEWRPVPSRA